jgi:hypothetical protein
MKLKREVLILTIVLAIVGFAKAKEPTSSNSQTVQAKPAVEAEEPSNVIASVADKIEQLETESFIPDSILYDEGNLNLSFQFNFPSDSTDFSVIQYYIKNIMPIVKNSDNKELDSIEVL